MKSNKGFSLVELIIIMGIASLLIGGSFVAFQNIQQADVKQGAASIGTYLDFLRTNTIARDGDWHMEVTNEDGVYYIRIIRQKTDESTGAISKATMKELKLGHRISIYANSESGDRVASGANPYFLTYKLKRSTGGLIPASDIGPGINSPETILVTNGDYKRYIRIVPLTGRYYIE